MKRGLFNILAGMSLMWCVATAALWVRSYYIYDFVTFNTPSYLGGIWFESGKAIIQLLNAPGQALHWRIQHVSGPAVRDRHFPWWRENLPNYWPGPMNAVVPGHWDRIVSLPFWLLFPTFGLLPSWLALRARRLSIHHGRQRQHQCVYCGYDLRATPDRCPECGTIPENNAQSLTKRITQKQGGKIRWNRGYHG